MICCHSYFILTDVIAVVVRVTKNTSNNRRKNKTIYHKLTILDSSDFNDNKERCILGHTIDGSVVVVRFRGGWCVVSSSGID